MGIVYSPRVVRDGLVLYLDAANVKSYSGSGTAWNDLSGQGNNGTLVNGVSYSTDNKGAMVFDGVNDYVSLPGIIFEKPFTLNLMCSAAEIKNQGFYSSRTIIGKGISIFALFSGSNTIRFDTGDNQWTTGYIIPLSEIVNLTLVVDDNSKKIYVNGILQYSISFTGQVNDISQNVTTIGCSQVDGISFDNFLNGSIPMVQAYNRALTAAEIQQNFEAMRGRYGI
jgi:hypothetical protein